MLHPRDLEAFLAVADTGSVSEAALAQFRSQPTLSRQVAALERALGAQVFRRSPSGMVLTPVGQRLEPLARDLVKRARRASAVMDGLSSERQRFTVACPETTGNFFIAPFVAAGGAIGDIVPAVPSDVYGRLRSGTDLAVNTAPPQRGLRGMQLASVDLRCQVPVGHPLANRESVELGEVIAVPFLMPGSGSAVQRVVSQAGELSGFALELASLTSNATLAQARSAAGQGPALVIEPALFELVSVPLRHQGAPLVVTLYAAWERTHYAHDELVRVVSELGAYMRRRIDDGGLASSVIP